MSVTTSETDAELDLSELLLIGPVTAIDLAGALSAPPVLERTIDGASTLGIDVADHRRALLRSGAFDVRSFAVDDDMNLELVNVSKSGDALSLTFEDAIVAALRRKKGGPPFEEGKVTRSQIARVLAGEAGVDIAIDPAPRPVIREDVERSSGADPEKGDLGEPIDYWTILQDVAAKIGWRCFSDGQRILFGSDDWLMARQGSVAVREHTGAVHDIDFELDIGVATSKASLDVDADAWAVPPGLAVDLLDVGPASGRWLVAKFTRDLTRTRAEVQLVRGRASLMEPEPAGGGDQGEEDFLPGGLLSYQVPPPRVGTAARSARVAEQAGQATTGSVGGPSTPGRVEMLRYATSKIGTKYVWGGNGPTGFDCSGLVQLATQAGGRGLAKPAVNQWNRGRREGREITVEEGIATRGALLFRAAGNGLPNHIAISTGDGFTLEARGSAYPNGRHPARGRNWSGAFLWL